ncbi:MAG: DNA alkylation repair protein [Candidatus Hydrogenedentes bacterium]|nr:DNA alkylation repair protein [Candidatus Hydrogenedentota bacterium]
MTLDDCMGALEREGTAQNRKTYARHGVTGPCFGVSYAALGKLKKAIKINHDLAVALWDSGNHDARVLACMIDDPAAVTAAELKARAAELSNYVLTDALSGLVAKSPHARACMTAWIKTRDEWRSSAGWNILAHLALAETGLPDHEFESMLARIESGIHGAGNRTRHTMNNALIAIGSRNEHLAELATAAAGRIGRVDVDHGETGCKTPDAAAYIAKTRAHYAAKGGITKRKRC